MPRRPLMPLPCLLALALAAGCRDLPERLIAENDKVALKAGLEAAEAAGRIKPLDEAGIADAAALARVLARPLSGAKLPPMTLTLRGTYAIELPGAPALADPPDGGAEDRPDGGAEAPPPEIPPQIEETRTLRLGPDGVYAFDHLSTAGGGDLPLAGDGRRCRWIDGRFYTAHRDGPYTAFAAVADEHHRCLDGALEPIGTLIRLFADRLAVKVEGPDVVLGRDVLPVALSAVAGGQAPPPLDPTYGADGLSEGDSPAIFGLRAPLVVGYTHVESFDGRLLLDTETGQPLGGTLTARLPFAKSGRRATLVVSMTLEASPFEGAVEVPEAPRHYGPRQRVFDERRRLLGEPKPATDGPALPAPGDAPRLGIDESGELRTESGGSAEPAPDAGLRDEDRPPEARPVPMDPPAPPPAQDEDRPE